MYLTSTVIGYFIFLITGLHMIFRRNIDILWISLFILVTLISIIFEISSFIQDLNSGFTGQHLRIGTLIFIAGLLIFIKNKTYSINKDQ